MATTHSIMRYPLSGTRADKDLYDEVSCSLEAAKELVVSLKRAHPDYWFWVAGEQQQDDRPRNWDGAATTWRDQIVEEVVQTPNQASLTALLAA